jgi:peptidyl-prolyl cis-trans isomerase SurA
MKHIIILLFICLFANSVLMHAQEGKLIDKVVAVIGDKPILYSEVEAQYEQYLAAGYDVTPNTRCQLFEDLLFQKLLLNQAELDSIEVPEAQIQQELERRIRFFVAQIGSEKKLEEFYQKSISQIKNEFHDLVKDQLMVQTIQQNISQDIKVTPSDVKSYFESLPKDSLPYINSEIELAHIVRKPPVSKEEKEIVKQKLEKIRERIMKGEDFGTLAYLYSEDPGSATKNGELGFMPRGSLVKEFSAVAFNLKENEISQIVETQFGFHLIQMIARRGEEVNVRHILLTPKVSPYDLVKAKNFLDSIHNLLTTIDTMSFAHAARKFSDDETTKFNRGKIINYMSGTTRFEMDQIGQMDPSLTFTIDKMKVGDISKPMVMRMEDGASAYRIIKLTMRTEPHIANLADDYQRIQEAALVKKEQTKMLNWVAKKVERTYISIDEEYHNCTFQNNWLKK